MGGGVRRRWAFGLRDSDRTPPPYGRMPKAEGPTPTPAPDGLAPEFHELDQMSAQLSDHPRLPRPIEPRQLLAQIDFLHGALSLCLNWPARDGTPGSREMCRHRPATRWLDRERRALPPPRPNPAR